MAEREINTFKNQVEVRVQMIQLFESYTLRNSSNIVCILYVLVKCPA